MGFSYFQNKSWDDITREERMFCAELFYQLRYDPSSFVELLIAESNVPRSLSGPWEAAYEACFYRDYLHHFHPKLKLKFPTKRTFDLVLFSEQAIIIIEAKVAELFKYDQSRYFIEDYNYIETMIKRKIEVYFVALATKKYFDNYDKFGRGNALKPFDGRFLTWEAVSKRYPASSLLKRACTIYKKPASDIIESDSLPSWLQGVDLASQIQHLREEIIQRQKLLDALEKGEVV